MTAGDSHPEQLRVRPHAITTFLVACKRIKLNARKCEHKICCYSRRYCCHLPHRADPLDVGTAAAAAVGCGAAHSLLVAVGVAVDQSHPQHGADPGEVSLHKVCYELVEVLGLLHVEPVVAALKVQLRRAGRKKEQSRQQRSKDGGLGRGRKNGGEAGEERTGQGARLDPASPPNPHAGTLRSPTPPPTVWHLGTILPTTSQPHQGNTADLRPTRLRQGMLRQRGGVGSHGWVGGGGGPQVEPSAAAAAVAPTPTPAVCFKPRHTQRRREPWPHGPLPRQTTHLTKQGS